MKRTCLRPGFTRALANCVYLIAVALPALALPDLASAQTLLHRYSFAADATDSVGGANGTIVPPGSGAAATITNGLILPGSGGGFGTSGYVSLPNGILTNTSSLTVEVWVTQNSANTWATAWDFGNNGSQNFALIPHPGNNGNNMEVAFTPNNNERDLQTPTAFPTGVEQYVSVTYNSSSFVANIFTNGILDATTTLTSAYTPGLIGGATGTTENMLGNDVYGDPQFNGTIFEFRIWNGVVSQRYIAASQIAGPGVVINNLTPTTASLVAGPAVVITGTEQAAFSVTLAQTGTNVFLATGDATNWVSANTNVVIVNSSGLITGVGVGSTTVSAKIAGVAATSGTITVTPQTLQHRYSFVSDATDSIGGANGTLVAPTTGAAAGITNGLILPGSTVAGNGVSGYLSLPPGILVGDTSVTVECWVTQNQLNTWAEIWDFGNNGNQNFALIPASPTPNMRVALAPNGGDIDLVAPTLPTNSEQYVTFTYNNSTLRGNLYLNGVLDGTVTYANTSYSPGTLGGASGTTLNTLGNDVYGDEQFNGKVFEFRIWNGAVSPLYIAVSAAAGPSVIASNLTPSAVTVNITNNTLIGAQTQQAIVTANFASASGVTVTTAATNWTSSNPSVLTVSSSGLITAVSGGTATVSATVGGVTATSPAITVQLTVPTITQQPTPVSVVVGDSATFTAAALGGNLFYQWKDGGVAIPGATNPSITLTNIMLSQAGNYSVTVTNALGSTNSVAVALAVNQSVLQHRYTFATDVTDSIGTANGTIVPGNNPVSFNNGLVLPGTGTSGTPSGYVTLPNNILQGDSSVTVECWVTQNQANTWAEIWSFGVNGGSVNFGLIPVTPTPNIKVPFTPNGGEQDIQSVPPLPSGQLEYMVVTYNAVNLTGTLYLNGTNAASLVLPNATYAPGSYNTTEDVIGSDPFGGDPQFNGTVSDLRIWDGVVSPLYIAVSSAAGPGTLVTNLTPTSVGVTVDNTTLNGGDTEQAIVSGTFGGVSGVILTGAATNWVSSNTNVLTVNANGLITAVGGGSATISATVAGTTGTSTAITVPLNPPGILVEPQANDTLLVGATLHATVVNDGVGPFTYKWFFNSSPTPIAGATSSTLTIPNIQLANAGSYLVTVGNAQGTVSSTPLVLSVVSPTPYQSSLLSLQPLAYWPLNETGGSVAFDVAGGFNGTYQNGVILGQPGVTNAGFGSNSVSVNFDGFSSYVDIPVGPFNITNAITIACWAQISAGTSPHFGDLVGHGDASWRIAENGGSGVVSGNDGGPPADATGHTSLIDGNWHLIVYTYDGTLTGNNGALYEDGTLIANNQIGTVPAGDNLDVWIGGAPDYGINNSLNRIFQGNLAHAAVFTKALTAQQVQALFAGQVEVSLSIKVSGSSVIVTWPQGTLQSAPSITGPWTNVSGATSPFTTAVGAGNKFFRVQTH